MLDASYFMNFNPLSQNSIYKTLKFGVCLEILLRFTFVILRINMKLNCQ